MRLVAGRSGAKLGGLSDPVGQQEVPAVGAHLEDGEALGSHQVHHDLAYRAEYVYRSRVSWSW